KPLITDTIYKRQKHPFIAPPVSRFTNDHLNSYIQDHLRSAAFKRSGLWDQPKVLNWLDQLPQMDAKDQAAAEPVLMMLLTSHLIGQRFALSRG
ncbi:MAG: asparagine synthetase B, partial [Pseudomonadota bacterium]|nr:asparagine synthetase B [Pseudomonadota bacterium]